MNKFIYIITEGVLDVVVLTQILRLEFKLVEVKRRIDLPLQASEWLNHFKWPVGDDIKHRTVPAPAFLLDDQFCVAIRNSQGIANIRRTMKSDHEAFLRLNLIPSAAGIVLDSDDIPPVDHFKDFAEMLEEHGYSRPQALEAIASMDGRPVGVFAFPGRGAAGTLEDILVPLGAIRFPELHKHADQYVVDWKLGSTEDHRELRKPSGGKKATLSAMVALLKPAKPLNASVEDQRWFPSNLNECPELQPLLEFLRTLFNSCKRES